MNVVDTSVRNNMDSTLGLNGVSIPAKQSRTVRGLDLDDERVRARAEAGDITIAAQEKPMYVQTEPELPEDAKAEDYLEDKPSFKDKLWGGASER